MKAAGGPATRKSHADRRLEFVKAPPEIPCSRGVSARRRPAAPAPKAARLQNLEMSAKAPWSRVPIPASHAPTVGTAVEIQGTRGNLASDQAKNQ